jgi:RND superfamily putative drug exporter
MSPETTTDDASSGPVRRGPLLWRAVALVVLIGVWLTIGALGGPKVGSLSSVQSNDQQSFLPANAESVEASRAAKAFDNSGALPAFVVWATDEATSPQQFASWQQVAVTMPSRPVDGAQPELGTIGDYLRPGTLQVVPSQDGRAGLLVVPLDQVRSTKQNADGENALSPLVESIRAAAAAGAAGAQSHVTGPAGIIGDLSKAFAGIDGILLLVAVLAVLIILFLVYRAVALPVLVLLSAVGALALAGWVVYELASAGHLTLSGQSQGILFILVVGAATDYGLLLVSRYREELHRYPSTWDALSRAWRACLAPIGASAGTVIIGLLCLTLSELNSNRSLGPVGAIGIAAALLAGLTFLPVLLLLGRWIFWPRVPHLDATGDPADVTTGLWPRVAAFVGRRPRAIWIVTAVVLGLFCAVVPTFKASGTPQTEVFLDPEDSVIGQQVLSEHFPAGAGNPAIIITPQGSADAVAAAAAVDGVASVGVLGAGGRPAGAGVPPQVADGNVQLQAVLTDPADSAAADATLRRLRDAVHAVDPAVLVGGQTAIQVDIRDAADHDLRVIIPIILVAVLLVLILLLRALVAPLLLMAATVLSFGATLGVSALVFNHLFGFPGADPAVPLYAFVFLVALGIDYSIFLMTRAREEVTGHGPREGVLRALRVTGGVITSAGVVLAATFAALGVIPILFLAQIAFIVAFGVLLDTLVVRSLLVPALSVDLGRTTWWPGRLSRAPGRHEAAATSDLPDH